MTPALALALKYKREREREYGGCPANSNNSSTLRPTLEIYGLRWHLTYRPYRLYCMCTAERGRGPDGDARHAAGAVRGASDGARTRLPSAEVHAPGEQVTSS